MTEHQEFMQLSDHFYTTLVENGAAPETARKLVAFGKRFGSNKVLKEVIESVKGAKSVESSGESE